MSINIKKINAVITMCTAAALLFHVGVVSYIYLTFNFVPLLCTISKVLMAVFGTLHVSCVAYMFLFNNDGSALNQYKRYNAGTIVQRVSAVLLLGLLFFHITNYNFVKTYTPMTFDQLNQFVLIEGLFQLIVFVHLTESFPRALITLGLITEEKCLKFTRIAVCIFNVVCCSVGLYAIITAAIGITKYGF